MQASLPTRIPSSARVIRAFLILLSSAFWVDTSFAQGGYFFTKIADEQGGFAQFDTTLFAINASGAVAFAARSSANGNKRCVFRGDGTTTTTIVVPPNTLPNQVERFASTPTINDAGVVAYYLYTGNIILGIGSGGATTTIADNTTTFKYFGYPIINNAGRVAFGASSYSGTNGVYLSSGNGAPAVLALVQPDYSEFFDGIVEPISVNDNNTAAFYGNYGTDGNGQGGEFGILSTSGGAATLIGGSANGFSNVAYGPAINNSGVVAFAGDKTGTGKGIFTGSGGATTTVVDLSGPFSTVQTPAINNNGDVAFEAVLDAGGGGIYLSTGGVIRRVVGKGDIIGGRTVTAVAFCRRALNDNGQIAFVVKFTDNTNGLYRATYGTQAPPSFNPGGQPTPRIAALGGSTTFTCSASGLPEPTYQWRKVTAAIKGATGSSYTLSNLQTSQAGSYNVVLKSALTSAAGIPSTAAELGVLDQTPHTINGVSGKNVTLTVTCSTNITGFKWYHNGSPLSDVTGHISGSGKKSLVITKLTNGSAGPPEIVSDAGTYHCEVTLPTITQGPITATSGDITLNVLDTKPDITDTYTLPDAMVGDRYDEDVLYDHSQNRLPTTWSTIPALPAGLKIDPATGHIGGTPTGSLTLDTTYPITIKASNAINSDTRVTSITVRKLPTGTVGTFVGYVNRLVAVNGAYGSRFDLTTVANGTFSGKIINGTTLHNFVGGKLDTDVHGVLLPSGTVTIKRPTLADLVLNFTIDPTNDRLATLTATVSGSTATGTAWRNVVPAEGYRDLHTLGLNLAVPNSALPKGTGYASYTVAPTGKLTVSGVLADGVAFTTAGHISKTGEVLFFLNSTTTDSLMGKVTQTPGVAADFSDYALNGTLSWYRRPQAATSHTYPAAFGVVSLNAVGAKYRKPPVTEVAMGLPYTISPATTENAKLTFTGADFGATAIAPDAHVLIKPGGKTAVIADANADRTTTFAAVPTTGVFNGKITLLDVNPVTHLKINRTVAYQGLIYRTPQGLIGQGYFLLPKVPAVTGQTIANTAMQSGLVVLDKLP